MYTRRFPSISPSPSTAGYITTLPDNGFLMTGGNSSTAGVNMTFGRGISQSDLDNIRAGKTPYNFYPAHVMPILVPHRGMTYKQIPSHYAIFPSYNFVAANSNKGLFWINQQLSIQEQQFEQGQNRNFNTGALTAVAAFVGAGVVAAGAGAGAGAGAAANPAPVTGGSWLDTAQGYVSSAYQTVSDYGTEIGTVAKGVVKAALNPQAVKSTSLNVTPQVAQVSNSAPISDNTKLMLEGGAVLAAKLLLV